MLNPDSEKGQYTPSDHDLTADAFLMFGAGTDTTANTLIQGTWYVLSNAKKDVMLDWATLEKLP